MKAVRSISLAATIAATAASTCWWGGANCEAEIGPWGEMPDLDMHVGDTVETAVADYWRPSECILDEAFALLGSDWWEISASDSAAVAVWLSADGRTLATAALEVADSVRVVMAYSEYPEVPHEFLVRVRPPVDGS